MVKGSFLNQGRVDGKPSFPVAGVKVVGVEVVGIGTDVTAPVDLMFALVINLLRAQQAAALRAANEGFTDDVAESMEVDSQPLPDPFPAPFFCEEELTKGLVHASAPWLDCRQFAH